MRHIHVASLFELTKRKLYSGCAFFPHIAYVYTIPFTWHEKEKAVENTKTKACQCTFLSCSSMLHKMKVAINFIIDDC